MLQTFVSIFWILPATPSILPPSVAFIAATRRIDLGDISSMLPLLCAGAAHAVAQEMGGAAWNLAAWSQAAWSRAAWSRTARRRACGADCMEAGRTEHGPRGTYGVSGRAACAVRARARAVDVAVGGYRGIPRPVVACGGVSVAISWFRCYC